MPTYQIMPKQPGPPPLTASCYICLESSADSNNQPLLRNCACRGDAGWAHIACLTKFAASKVTELEAQCEQDPSINLNNVNSFWEDCILCKTPHMQDMGLAMAEAFVKQYEHLPDITSQRSSPRFASLECLALTKFNAGDIDGALVLFVRLQQICDSFTSSGVDARIVKAQMCTMVAAAFVQKKQLNDALAAFEQQRELYVATYGPHSPQVQESNEHLVELKERIRIKGLDHQEKGDTAADLAVARQEFKKCREQSIELAYTYRLYPYLNLIAALDKDGRHQEAMEFFVDLVAESRQTLGPNHPDTQNYLNGASTYSQKIKKGAVWAVIDCEQQPAVSGQRVQVLRAMKGNKKYICLIKNHNGISSKFKVTHNQFILETGTAVMIHGVVSSADLNNGSIGIIRSFDKETRLYAVYMGKKKTVASIKPINLCPNVGY